MGSRFNNSSWTSLILTGTAPWHRMGVNAFVTTTAFSSDPGEDDSDDDGGTTVEEIARAGRKKDVISVDPFATLRVWLYFWQCARQLPTQNGCRILFSFPSRHRSHITHLPSTSARLTCLPFCKNKSKLWQVMTYWKLNIEYYIRRLRALAFTLPSWSSRRRRAFSILPSSLQSRRVVMVLKT